MSVEIIEGNKVKVEKIDKKQLKKEAGSGKPKVVFEEVGTIKVGDRIEVQGLSRDEFNGKKGKVVSGLNAKGRIGVRLDWKNKGLMLRPQNIKLSGTRLIPKNLLGGTGKKFYPTKNWQAIPEGMKVPPGCDYRIDTTTGKTMVKLADGQAENQKGNMSKKTEQDLKSALSWGDAKKVKDILNSGGNPSENFLKDVIFQAVQTGNEELVKLLLNKGASSHCRNPANFTPLHVAVRDGHEEVAKVLIKTFETRKQLENQTNKGNKTVLDYARDMDMGSMAKRLDKFMESNLKKE